MKPKNRHIIPSVIVLAVAAFLAYGLIAPMSTDDTARIDIDERSTPDHIRQQVGSVAPLPQRTIFRLLASVTGYYSHLRPGRYDIGSSTSTLMAFRHMRNGIESPVRLTIPSTLRTAEDLAEFLGHELHPSADEFYKALTDTALLATYGLQPATATTIFLPNTYEVYWSTSVGGLFERMQRESEAFWIPERTACLNAIAPGFTREQAITLASIVEQETQHAPERADVAGMYINRLHCGMPLQADPTVKYAVGDFTIRRIMQHHLAVDSPYNTYRHPGLPPGPICIPSLSSIDAVLHYRHHNYLYMCAKEDFSGSHNFAVTYADHLSNARKYAEALDHRNIH